VTTLDKQLLAIASTPLKTIPDVIATLEALGDALPDGDGLKWFNWLYLTVTKAVDLSLAARPWHNPDWVARLDVVFAALYTDALTRWLTPGQAPPECWAVLFRARNDARLARIQFALGGMNAHIDHDLALAVMNTCSEFHLPPIHLSQEYQDYCAVNELLDAIIERAKKELLTGLLGNNLPCIQLVENLAAMWGLRATREAAWTNAEMLCATRLVPGLAARFLAGLDSRATLAGRGLLVPVGTR